jgi:peptidoglycan/LPS O-acetylase OafA/YrhL
LLRAGEVAYARHAGFDEVMTGRILYWWSFGQFEGFGIGALMALHPVLLERPKARRAFFGVAAGAAIVALACTILLGDGGHPLPLRAPSGAAGVPFYTAVIALAAMALAVAIGPESRLKRLLRWPPLVRVGQLSYGLYVWHPLVIIPAFALFGATLADASKPLRLALALPCLALSIGISSLSYRFFESRFHTRIGPGRAGASERPLVDRDHVAGLHDALPVDDPLLRAAVLQPNDRPVILDAPVGKAAGD